MSRYRAESARISAGVLMSSSRASHPKRPTSIRTATSTAHPIREVVTAVFMSRYCLAPKKRDTMTEQPMLHPKAKAMKIRVIS